MEYWSTPHCECVLLTELIMHNTMVHHFIGCWNKISQSSTRSWPTHWVWIRSDQTRHSAGGHHSERRMEAHSSDSTCGECTCVHVYILYMYLCWMRCTCTWFNIFLIIWVSDTCSCTVDFSFLNVTVSSSSCKSVYFFCFWTQHWNLYARVFSVTWAGIFNISPCNTENSYTHVRDN